MAKQAIPLTEVICTDNSTDYEVGYNPNNDPNDKVQAFVDTFRQAAVGASGMCYNLPIKVILGMWGGESGWATGPTQLQNQNFANMTYTSSSNPVDNIGEGVGGWAKFEGLYKHARGFAYFFRNNSRYADLISYLQSTSSPDADTCITYIANAGYGGSDHAAYAAAVRGYVSTLVNRSDVN